MAVARFQKTNKSQLEFHQAEQLHRGPKSRSAIVGLSIIDVLATSRSRARDILQTLPPVPVDKIDDESIEFLNRVEQGEADGLEQKLPEHLQPRVMDDGMK